MDEVSPASFINDEWEIRSVELATLRFSSYNRNIVALIHKK